MATQICDICLSTKKRTLLTFRRSEETLVQWSYFKRTQSNALIVFCVTTAPGGANTKPRAAADQGDDQSGCVSVHRLSVRVRSPLPPNTQGPVLSVESVKRATLGPQMRTATVRN
jgi:hypothetical protein